MPLSKPETDVRASEFLRPDLGKSFNMSSLDFNAASKKIANDDLAHTERDALKLEEMRILVANAKVYPVLLPLMMGAITFIFCLFMPSTAPLTWFSASLLLSTVVSLWLYRYRRLDKDTQISDRVQKQLRFLLISMSWLVASPAIWAWAPGGVSQNVFVIYLLLSGLLMAVANFSVRLSLVYWAGGPFAVGLLVRPLAEGGELFFALAGLGVISTFILFQVGHHMHKSIRENVILRTAKEDLIGNLKAHESELIERQDHLHKVLDNIVQGVCVYDKESRLTAWNRAFIELLSLPDDWPKAGRSLEEFILLCADRGDYISVDIDDLIARRVTDIKGGPNGAKPHHYERTLASGRILEIFGNPMPDGGVVTTYQDVTERRLAERLLSESTEEITRQLKELSENKSDLEQRTAEAEAMAADLILARRQSEDSMTRIKSIFDTAADGLITMDESGLIDAFNPAAENMFGYSTADTVGKNLSSLISDAHRAELDQQLHAHRNGETSTNAGGVLELEAKKRNGDVFPIELSVAAMDLAGKSMFTAVVRDISERKQAAAAIRRMALNDTLTGLPNRNLFHRRLSDAVKNARRLGRNVGVVLLDINQFKRINDTLGPDAGDDLLKVVGVRLNDCLREVDTVARLGGDQFGLIMTNLEETDQIDVPMNRILDAVAAPIEMKGDTIRMSTSIGIAVCPSDSEDPTELVRKSEVALSEAKAAGTGTYRLFDQAMDAAAKARHELEEGLRVAVEEEQFELYYQPLIDMVHERVIGAEALIRWNHPERGLVPPMEFIGAAEVSGHIIPMGEWALMTACRQAQAWKNAGLPPMRMAVNVSARQFAHANLLDCVKAAIEETGIPPDCLELEINEGMVMSDTEEVIEKLQALRDLGIQLAIDDFGTGYSSLSYLKRLPVDRLKIDQSFIRDIDTDKDDESITEAIITMGQSLKLAVIAEGVETAEHVRHLLRKGCSEGQGYFYNRPVPAAEFAEWVETFSADKGKAPHQAHAVAGE